MLKLNEKIVQKYTAMKKDVYVFEDVSGYINRQAALAMKHGATDPATELKAQARAKVRNQLRREHKIAENAIMIPLDKFFSKELGDISYAEKAEITREAMMERGILCTDGKLNVIRLESAYKPTSELVLDYISDKGLIGVVRYIPKAFAWDISWSRTSFYNKQDLYAEMRVGYRLVDDIDPKLRERLMELAQNRADGFDVESPISQVPIEVPLNSIDTILCKSHQVHKFWKRKTGVYILSVDYETEWVECHSNKTKFNASMETGVSDYTVSKILEVEDAWDKWVLDLVKTDPALAEEVIALRKDIQPTPRVDINPDWAGRDDNGELIVGCKDDDYEFPLDTDEASIDTEDEDEDEDEE